MARKDALITGVVIGIAAAFVAGLGLAVYRDDATWLILSAVAFIVIYAG